ncbi:MAG TPA: alkylhydroperoxidase domain protein [Candidatus Dormibacteraeota bacterium]|nr:alkylhydroperoxidase domain protein [Candidatus Dormibacteraeota bacterium]
MTDVLNALAGIVPGSPLAALRERRAEAREHTQGSYRALFQPAEPGGVSRHERAAIAVRVAAAHRDRRLADHYAAALANGEIPADRLDAELAHADLLATHPADAGPEHLVALGAAGLSVRDIVTVSQVIAYVSFQARVLAALLLLGGQPVPAAEPARKLRSAAARRRFTQAELGWQPWVAPLGEDEAGPEEQAALGARAGSPYFRLLARDPAVLVERTATDVAIFRSEGGLPRAERELGAVAASLVNGCVYCASVHARFASHFSGRSDDVQRLLDQGLEAPLDDRWRALVGFAAALGQTPPRADASDVAALREVGLDDLEILDLAQATAFFAWANRLMLTLGEPTGAEAVVGR